MEVMKLCNTSENFNLLMTVLALVNSKVLVMMDSISNSYGGFLKPFSFCFFSYSSFIIFFIQPATILYNLVQGSLNS